MSKILPKLYTNASRYIKKNTVNGKYNRYMDGAMLSGIGAITHAAVTLPYMTAESGFANLSLWGVYFTSVAAALKKRIELIPIRKRAKLIKKAAKKNGHKIQQ